MGTAATRANVDIGVNFQSLGSATGLLDATQGNVKIHADEFNLGYSPFEIGGAATGTLRWDSPNTLDANAIYISRGMGSGILELASGATFISRSSVLALAYNDSGSSTGTTLANLDLTVNNPTFSAFVGSVLFIGNKAYLGEFSVASNANGSLILGSNSNLTVGTAAARAYVYVGVNSQASVRLPGCSMRAKDALRPSLRPSTLRCPAAALRQEPYIQARTPPSTRPR